MLLHDGLANPGNRTNLHEEHHVVYPALREAAGSSAARASFFDPVASGLRMQPRLSDTWTTPPLGVRDFVQKLKWLTLGSRQSKRTSRAP